MSSNIFPKVSWIGDDADYEWSTSPQPDSGDGE